QTSTRSPRRGSPRTRSTSRGRPARTRSFGAPDELLEQARFALEESLGVKRVLELEQLVIQVMAELVEQRPQERPKRDHAPVMRGPHPHRDDGWRAFLGRFVQAVQLARARARPAR